jgi:NADPH:quinone reductase-like Zn-dependent oxidoreductase
MKAAVQRMYGPPEVVLISEMDKPAPGDNEVLVKVEATTVNRTDCACRAARPFFMRLFTGLRRSFQAGVNLRVPRSEAVHSARQ